MAAAVLEVSKQMHFPASNMASLSKKKTMKGYSDVFKAQNGLKLSVTLQKYALIL